MLWVINAHNIEKHEGTPRSDYKSKDENFENLLVKLTENGKAVRIYMTVEQAMLAKVNRPSSRLEGELKASGKYSQLLFFKQLCI